MAAFAALAGVVPAQHVGAVALAGSQVVWSKEAARPEVYAGTHRVWRARVVPVPPDAADDSFYDARVTQTITALRASRKRVAFLHVATLQQDPKCAHAQPPCLGAPSKVRQLVGEVWAGPPGGPFRIVSRGCARDEDVSGTRVAIVERRTCEYVSPTEVVVAGRRRDVVARQAGYYATAVAFAGAFAAVVEEPRCAADKPPISTALALLDLASGDRQRYCLTGAHMFQPWQTVDVDASGRVAAAMRDCTKAVSWVTPGGRWRFLPLGADPSSGIRIAHSRIAFAWRDSCDDGSVRLAVVDLGGRHLLTLPSMREPAPFDFDGRRLAYAAPDGIHVVRVP